MSSDPSKQLGTDPSTKLGTVPSTKLEMSPRTTVRAGAPAKVGAGPSSDDVTAELCGPGRRGLLFVVSAPSGTGKTTVVEKLVQNVSDLVLSRSYTSRPARPGEVDGVDYNFITRARFEEMIAAEEFLEWADVFGNLYGTCGTDAERALATGRDLVLVIDVQGARKVRRRCPDTVGIFVMPPDFATLERRLRGRSKDPEDAIQRRLRTARAEVAAFTEYEYVIVNDELEACVDRLRAIVLAERARLRSARPAAEAIVESFNRKEPL